MMKLLKAILCFIIFLPFCGWKVEEQTIHKVSNTLHTVNSPGILVNDITIHDDFVSIEFLYTVSTVGITDYTYRIENQQLMITLFGEFPDGDTEYFTNITIPVQHESYRTILLCDENEDRIIYREQ